jgi:hypothetical protein
MSGIGGNGTVRAYKEPFKDAIGGSIRWNQDREELR